MLRSQRRNLQKWTSLEKFYYTNELKEGTVQRNMATPTPSIETAEVSEEGGTVRLDTQKILSVLGDL